MLGVQDRARRYRHNLSHVPSDPQVHQGRNGLTRAIAIPGAPTPVNEMSVQAAIMSPEAYAYGATITPAYLK